MVLIPPGASLSAEYNCFFCGKHYNLACDNLGHCFWIAVQEEQGIPMGPTEYRNKSEWRCCDDCAPLIEKKLGVFLDSMIKKKPKKVVVEDNRK